MAIKEIVIPDSVQRDLRKLPLPIRRKFYEQLGRYLQNPAHPSLRVHELRSCPGIKSLSLTKKYRVTFFMELSEQFSLYALEHPEILEQIPERAQVVFLPEDDPELAEQNQKLLDRFSQEQVTMVIVRMRPAERVIRTRVPIPQLEVVRG